MFRIFKYIEDSCNVKFKVIEEKEFKFDKVIRHNVFKMKSFNHYEELLKDNYRVYINSNIHDNFSYHNSIWISKDRSKTTITHELMHMLTGKLYHYGSDHILSPYKNRVMKINKEDCNLIKIDRWKTIQSFDTYVIF